MKKMPGKLWRLSKDTDFLILPEESVFYKILTIYSCEIVREFEKSAGNQQPNSL
jgi:hypothetical protein